MTDLDELDAALASEPIAPPSLTGAAGRPKCWRHDWERFRLINAAGVIEVDEIRCFRCRVLKDELRSRRGRNNRSYGNRAELKASRLYGGTKVGHAGGPVDIRGKDFNTQVKTHRRLPPREWTKAFGALEASGDRLPRLLLRFLPGPGLPPVDYFVVPGKAWADWFGRDDEGDE